jgi:hypothetical protein
MTEIWEDIKGYEGLYQVSNQGRIKSLDRRVRCRYDSTRVIGESILQPLFNKANKQYSIQLRKDGKTTHHLISRIVAEAFVDNPNDLPWLIFADGDKLNFRASNLMYVSRDERLEFFRSNKSTKTKTFSPQTYRTRLDKEKEDDIRLRRASGETYASIAKRYSIAVSNVWNICRSTDK